MKEQFNYRMSSSSVLCESHSESDYNGVDSETVKLEAQVQNELDDIYLIHCRLCANILNKCEGVPIFEGDKCIADKISQCLPIVITPQDNFPKFICETCVGQLELSSDLIMKSIESELFFKKQLEDELKKQETERKAFLALEKKVDIMKYLLSSVDPDGPVICDLCGNKKFSNMETFDFHMVSVHNAPQLGHPEQVFTEDGRCMYECPACSKQFESKSLLQSHQRTHGNLICKSCQQFHSDAQKLQRHICPATNATANDAELNIHEQEVHNLDDKQNSDDTSLEGARTRQVPDKTSRSKSQERDEDKDKYKFECRKCYRRFMSAGNLVKHMSSHEEQVICDVCDGKFSSYSAMLKHRRLHGGKPSSSSCNLCSRVFYKHAQLVRHLEKEHNVSRSDSSPWCCRFCNKRMMTKLGLVSHERIHTGIRPFVCSWCGTAFRSRANLIQHHPVHTKAKTHPCGVCGKTFSRKSFVRTHMRVHTGDRPYACELCDAKFTQSGDLGRHNKKIHMLSHQPRKKGAKENVENRVILHDLDNEFDKEDEANVIEVHVTSDPQEMIL